MSTANAKGPLLLLLLLLLLLGLSPLEREFCCSLNTLLSFPLSGFFFYILSKGVCGRVGFLAVKKQTMKMRLSPFEIGQPIGNGDFFLSWLFGLRMRRPSLPSGSLPFAKQRHYNCWLDLAVLNHTSRLPTWDGIVIRVGPPSWVFVVVTGKEQCLVSGSQIGVCVCLP